MQLEGWGPAVKMAVRHFATPWTRSKAVEESPPIRVMRVLSISFGAGLAGILLVMQFIDLGSGDAETYPIWIWAATTPICVAAFYAYRRVRARSVAEATEPELMVGVYRTRMFLQIAFAELPALVAFMVAFVSETLTPYLVTLPVSLLLISVASPRTADISSVQSLIDESGGQLRLADLLMGHYEPGR